MTDLGKVGMRPRGEHVDGNVYEKNDIAKYENVVYCCLKDTPNPPSETDTEFWQVWARDASPMVGATSTSDGAGGIVPKPMRGDENKTLLGSGVWGDVNVEVDSALSDTSENPVQNKVVNKALEAKFDKTGDSKDVVTSFASNDELAPTELAQMPDILKTGEKHASIFGKVSTVFRNMRYIIGLLGNTDISKELLGLGDSTLTGAVSAINESLHGYGKKLNYNTETSMLQLKNGEKVLSEVEIQNDKPKYVSFESGTVEEITEMLNAHYKGDIDISDYWSVGDKRLITTEAITDTSKYGNVAQAKMSVYMRILHKDYGKLLTPTSARNKAAFVIGFETCLPNKDYRHFKYEGTGYNTNELSWGDDNDYLRKFLNDLVFQSIPYDIRALIKRVFVPYNKYNDEKSYEIPCDIWLPEEFEMQGTKNRNITISPTEQFEYYKVQANRVKTIGGGSVTWYRRDVYNITQSKDLGIEHVGFNGNCTGTSSYGPNGICPHFCI